MTSSWRQSCMRLQGQLLAGRRAAGLTQAEVAERLGVSRRTFQRMEDGEADPSFMLLFHWADVVGIAITSAPRVKSVKPDALMLIVDPADLDRFRSVFAHHFASLTCGEDAADGRVFPGNCASSPFPTPTGAAR